MSDDLWVYSRDMENSSKDCQRQVEDHCTSAPHSDKPHAKHKSMHKWIRLGSVDFYSCEELSYRASVHCFDACASVAYAKGNRIDIVSAKD